MSTGAIDLALERSVLAQQVTERLDAVACLVARARARHAGSYGLSDAKLELLETICGSPERRDCLHALGERLGVSRANVTKLVDGLERGGLVERLPHPSDRRMVQAHVTAEGLELTERASPGRRERMVRVWDVLDDGELVALADLLEAVVARADVPMPGADPRATGAVDGS